MRDLGLRRLHDEVHVTSLFVTHDQQEAFEVSDQIVVLNRGKVEQMGPPQTLYEQPASPFVTEFLGSVNVLPFETVLNMDRNGHDAPLPLNVPGRDSPALVYVRPHDLDVTRTVNGRPAWTATVGRLTRLGPLVRLELTLVDGTALLVQLTRERCLELDLAEGESVFVTLQRHEGLPPGGGVRRRLRDLTRSRTSTPPLARTILMPLRPALRLGRRPLDGHGSTLGPPVLEKMLRSIIVYVFLVLLLRVFGSCELA